MKKRYHKTEELKNRDRLGAEPIQSSCLPSVVKHIFFFPSDIPYTADLVFVPHLPTSGETVDSGDPVVLNSTGLTVSFWVRYTGQGRFTPGTILTLYGLK